MSRLTRALAIGARGIGALGIATAAACARMAPAPHDIPFSVLAAAPIAPADHRVAYDTGALQFGDLRLPATRGSVPVVVLIHGGCWRAAYDLAHASQAAAALTRTGLATWSIEYRRVGDAGGGWPGTFADVARGVDHVRTLAARFPQLDTTRVVLVGHSAGGQLALWAASRRAGERLGDRAVAAAPLAVAGVVGLAAITDLRAYGAARGGCNSAVTALLGGTATEVPERYAMVSPVERGLPGGRVQLVHGAADPIVPPTQSRAFAARVREHGGEVVLTDAARAGHFDLVAPQSEAWPAVVRAVRALTARP